ncbi:MAG: hypothetical protein JST61_17050 [Acidobacteria bacterium]|nr:hypothetical protein [Acidobacteriota bacterium]
MNEKPFGRKLPLKGLLDTWIVFDYKNLAHVCHLRQHFQCVQKSPVAEGELSPKYNFETKW